jgi:hypothetical protein
MRGNENVVLSYDEIRIPELKGGGCVMHRGETSLMRKLAEIVTKNGGDILEIGFGMHLSADGIQSNPNVTSHTIIEVHPDIYKNALIWAKDKPNVKILLGDWIYVLPTIQLKFDGVLHDTHLDSNIPKFLDYVKPNCKEGTIVGFFDTLMMKDSRFNAVRHKLTDVEYDSLPYKNDYFKYGDYELKYTTFNGIDFERDKTSISLI